MMGILDFANSYISNPCCELLLRGEIWYYHLQITKGFFLFLLRERSKTSFFFRQYGLLIALLSLQATSDLYFEGSLKFHILVMVII